MMNLSFLLMPSLHFTAFIDSEAITKANGALSILG
jgi:hypothetical protein